MNTATQEVLDRLGKYQEEFNTVAQFGDNLGSINKIDNQELLEDKVLISIELPAMDPTIVKESLCMINDKFYLAGDKLTLKFNHYGQLGIKLGKYPVKGSTFKTILKEIYTDYFHPVQERSIDAKWVVVKGYFKWGKKRDVKFLFRGETIIGIFTKNTKVSSTIKWYEKAIYKSKSFSFNKAHDTVTYRPEVPNEVYDIQYPEFTKEKELEEIRAFITSLKTRRLGNEEREVINDIYSELGIMVDGSKAQDMSDDELLQECIARGI